MAMAPRGMSVVCGDVHMEVADVGIGSCIEFASHMGLGVQEWYAHNNIPSGAKNIRSDHQRKKENPTSSKELLRQGGQTPL